MLRDIYLYGDLGEKFGKRHRFEIETAADICWALESNYGGFFRSIKREGLYQIIVGDDLGGRQLSQEELLFTLEPAPVHIVPVIEGSSGSSKGIFTAILGIALIAIPFVGAAVAGTSVGALMGAELGAVFPSLCTLGSLGTITFGQLALLGGVLTLAGISQIFSPTPQVNSYDRDKEKKNSLFTGPVNTMEQGVCVPVVYGRFTIGSHVISAGIKSIVSDDGTSPTQPGVTIIHKNNPAMNPNFDTDPEPGLHSVTSGGDFTIKITSSKQKGQILIQVDYSDAVTIDLPLTDTYEYKLTNITTLRTVTVAYVDANTNWYTIQVENDETYNGSNYPAITLDMPDGEYKVVAGLGFSVKITFAAGKDENGFQMYVVDNGEPIPILPVYPPNEDYVAKYDLPKVSSNHTLVFHAHIEDDGGSGGGNGP